MSKIKEIIVEQQPLYVNYNFKIKIKLENNENTDENTNEQN